MQADPCFFLLSLIYLQNLCPAFSFLRKTQKEKANIKNFGKGKGGAGGKERTFFKRFFLSPCRQGAAIRSGKDMPVPA
jgi:hypothetical protein